MNKEQKEKRQVEIDPERFYSLVEGAALIGIPAITLKYFSDVGAIPYKLENGEQFFRYQTLINFYNGKEFELKAGEKYSKNWK